MTIEHILKATGMTQKSMAQDLNIPIRSIENWVSGKRKPPEYLVFLIAEHYNVTASE